MNLYSEDQKRRCTVCFATYYAIDGHMCGQGRDEAFRAYWKRYPHLTWKQAVKRFSRLKENRRAAG